MLIERDRHSGQVSWYFPEDPGLSNATFFVEQGLTGFNDSLP